MSSDLDTQPLPGGGSGGSLPAKTGAGGVWLEDGTGGLVYSTPKISQLGAPTTDVAWGSHKITGLTNGSSAQDAAAFGQIPTKLSDLAGANAADIALNSHKLTGLTNGAGAQDAAAFGQIPTTLAGLSASAGDYAMGTHKLTGLSAPAIATDSAQATAQRYALYQVALGFLTESFPSLACNANSALTSQTVYGAGVYLFAGEVITGVVCNISTAGSGTAPTNFKAGIWTSAATPVCGAVSSDYGSDSMLTSGGPKKIAFTGTYTVPSSGIYYPCLWENGAFGTTTVKFASFNGQTAQIGLGGGGSSSALTARPGTALKTSTATMAAADTGAYSAGAGLVPWLAVY